MTKFLIGFLILAGGFVFTLKPQWIQSFYGRIGVAERGVFATFGGSRFFIQLIGIVMIILAGVIMFADFSSLRGMFGT
ncbi:MAG: hypothetical protein PHH01_00100 [Patescibacteria group bacterium]|nr:hypothetical protein [Patescibacteria group bacterium]MDD5566588.1 hypothetical protein [Patescibacteria group bacterium]